jgi:N-acetylneuraminic acid mutarotase
VLSGFLGFSSISLAEEKWTKKADMPIALDMVSACDVNGKIYVIGTNVNRSLMKVLEYDPVTDEWMSKSDAITTGRFSSVCVVNGKIYAFGGVSFDGKILSTVEEYDPKTDTWTKKANMPTPRYDFSTSAVDGKIYAIGGIGGNITNSINDLKILSAVEEYDPTADIWTKKADIPSPRAALSTCAVNGNIYVFGGEGGAEQKILLTVEEYNPNEDVSNTSGVTLRTALTENGIDTENIDMSDIDKNINSYDTLNDPKMFCIAYYLGDGSNGLGNKLYVRLYKKDENKWLYEVLDLETLIVKLRGTYLTQEDFVAKAKLVVGSIGGIHSSKDHIYIFGHISPSAGTTLVLSNDLKYQDAFYGWVLAIFDDETVVYYNSQVHFAPTYYVEISIYNPNTKMGKQIYPMKPYQEIRLEHIRKVKEAYDAIGEDWFRENNHHMNPELFNNNLGKVAINNNTHSLAFVISYDNSEISKAFPETTETTDVVYVYKNVNNGKEITYKEILLSDLKAKYGDVPISEYLEPERLDEIFGGN